MGLNSFVAREEIDYSQTKQYQKLQEFLNKNKDVYTKAEIEEILDRFGRTYFNKVVQYIKPNDALNYVFNSKPELLSFYDMIKSKTPILKFIWLFYKEDEQEVDNIFLTLNLQTEKDEILTDKGSLIIRVVKIPYEPYDFSGGIFGKGINKSLDVTHKKGYMPFELLKTKMIKHGMSWLDYSCHERFNLSDCHLSKVRDLSQSNGWTNEGWRKDIKCAFRSSWEANIARLLNYKGIEWNYENEWIVLDLTKENVKITPNYIPDFTLEDNSIIEVKGFWDMRSKTKMKFVREQFPDRKILIIDTDLYYSIYRKYKDIIPNWEESNVSTFNDTIQIVGITIPNRKRFVDALSIGDELTLVRDADNKFDSNAIKVINQDGYQVGFVAKDWANILASKIDLGFRYSVTVKEKQPKVLQCNATLINREDVILPDVFK